MSRSRRTCRQARRERAGKADWAHFHTALTARGAECLPTSAPGLRTLETRARSCRECRLLRVTEQAADTRAAKTEFRFEQ